jgi:uncharacterized membrane protein YbhN (UPF0104 family)
VTPGSIWSLAGDIAGHLAGIDPALAVLALTFHVANHLLRSLAWRSVVSAAYPEQRVPYLRIASAYAAGVALNAVAPARGGDAAKIALARVSLHGSSVATLASTMSVLVAFDVLAATALVVAAGASGAVPLSLPAPGTGRLWLVAGIAVAAVALAWLAHRFLRPRLRALLADLKRGGAILRTPRSYAVRVVAPQTAAWCCRVGVVLCLLAAFGLPASVPLAGVVMVLTGASTIVPLTPGGAGTQQMVLAFALSQTASATAVLSFSLGMQAGVTLVNGLLGVAAAMAIARTARPVAAVRGALRLLPSRAA